MADTTTRYGWPYQEAGDPPDGAALGQDLAEAVETTVGAIDDRVDTLEDTATVMNKSFSSFSTTAQPALTTAAATEGLVTTVSADFKSGYAYEISWQFRAQINGGTSPFYVAGKLFRTNASGTAIDASGGEAIITTNFMVVKGSCIVKRTGADTTQTIALTASFSSSGGPSSLDIEASTTSRTRLVVRPVGLAADYSGAMEVPTA